MENLSEKLIAHINTKKNIINSWLNKKFKKITSPLYSSVDIRHATFKAAVVDTNIYPGGFNNLCSLAHANGSTLLKKILKSQFPNAKKILIFIEEHTRNTWYLENVRVLKSIIENIGYELIIGTHFNKENSYLSELKLKTAKGYELNIKNANALIKETNLDLIILNNDLTNGIPNILKNTSTPILPAKELGWHTRKKSYHFLFYNELIEQLAMLINLDPWLLSCLHLSCSNIDLRSETDQNYVANKAFNLLNDIRKKYKEHQINEKPFIFLKSNHGTYGLGIKSIESIKEIFELNSRTKNNLSKGKQASITKSFIIQEGVPNPITKNKPGEPCIYQVGKHTLGGFFRSNSRKSERENLNSKGMFFTPMCLKTDNNRTKHDICGIKPDSNQYLYEVLAKIATIASSIELEHILKIKA